jgi:hypothetical protein
MWQNFLEIVFRQEDSFSVWFLVITFSFLSSLLTSVLFGTSNREGHNIKYARYFFQNTGKHSVKLLFHSFWEELIFRFLPIVIAYYALHFSKEKILIVCVASSFVFAVGHMWAMQAVAHHFPTGLLWCLLFVKTGGLSGTVLPSLMLCVTAHFVLNFAAIFFNYISNRKKTF